MNNDDPEPPRVHYSFKPTQHPRMSDRDRAGHPEPIDVKKILHDNFVAEGGKPAPKLRPVKWKSRRTRDYLFLVTAPNAIILLLMYVLPKHELIPVFGFSLMALYTLAITWLMWVVMDGH